LRIYMSVDDEFATVDLVRNSRAETRGVDAFALSLIKAEKQARRLFTYLVYQHPWCDRTTVPELKKALEESRRVYFTGLVRGWNALYPQSVEQLVGVEYGRLRRRVDEATTYRNKIFHGQLTSRGLSRTSLESLADDIRAWCHAFGSGALAEIGYDGCGRNSFRKASSAATLCSKYKTNFAGAADYRTFIRAHME